MRNLRSCTYLHFWHPRPARALYQTVRRQRACASRSGRGAEDFACAQYSGDGGHAGADQDPGFNGPHRPTSRYKLDTRNIAWIHGKLVFLEDFFYSTYWDQMNRPLMAVLPLAALTGCSENEDVGSAPLRAPLHTTAQRRRTAHARVPESPRCRRPGRQGGARVRGGPGSVPPAGGRAVHSTERAISATAYLIPWEPLLSLAIWIARKLWRRRK